MGLPPLIVWLVVVLLTIGGPANNFKSSPHPDCKFAFCESMGMIIRPSTDLLLQQGPRPIVSVSATRQDREDELPQAVPYLDQCNTVTENADRLGVILSTPLFTDATELQADIRALSAIDQILGDQLAGCDASARLQHITRQSLQFLQLALEAEQHTVNGRNVFINLDDVPDLYHSRVVSEILLQLERVERVFIEDVGLDPGKQAVGFVITDQALTEEDIGGSAFGSFIWLPVAYTTTFGQAIPQGVRETTVRHEIVHVFMNQIATSRHRVQFPEVFIEGMALYLAENQFVEWQQGNGITLSDDYMLYLDAFREMERVGGDRAVHELIREVLIGQEPGFYARFELITGQSYSSFVGGDLTSLLRIERWVKSRINALPVGLRYAIVLGFIVLAIAVFVALVDSGKRQVQRNMGVVFILFASFVLISQGRAINYVLENPLGYILVVIIVLSIIAVASTPRRSIYPESDDDDQEFSEDDNFNANP